MRDVQPGGQERLLDGVGGPLTITPWCRAEMILEWLLPKVRAQASRDVAEGGEVTGENAVSGARTFASPRVERGVRPLLTARP